MADRDDAWYSQSERDRDRATWRLDALDKWRDETEKRISILESKVSDMTLTEEVANLLSKRLAEHRREAWTIWQKLGAGIAGVVVLAESVKNLLGL